MKAVKLVVAIAVSGVALACYASWGIAQHVTGELGSPSATTTLSGTQLPPPDPTFGGVIQDKASESRACTSKRVFAWLQKESITARARSCFDAKKW